MELIKKGEVELEKPGRYVLQWHYWKKRTLIRVGPSAEHYDLRVEVPGRRRHIHFICYHNPLDFPSGVAAIRRDCDDPSWLERGLKHPEEIPPGKPGNPSKDTPAYVEAIAHGKAVVLVSNPMVVKIQFLDGDMKGVWLAEREDAHSDVWVLRRVAAAPGDRAQAASQAQGAQRGPEPSSSS